MELDTGASVTVAGVKELKQEIGPLPKMEQTSVKLRMFGGKVIKPLGVVQLQVQYKQQSNVLTVVVTAESGPGFMGRNWLRELQLDWKGIMAEIFPVTVEEKVMPGVMESGPLGVLLKEFKDIFTGGWAQ